MTTLNWILLGILILVAAVVICLCLWVHKRAKKLDGLGDVHDSDDQKIAKL